jgi:hypothetical protein
MTANDPKLSDGRGGHDACMVGGKAAAEAGGMTNPPVRCSAWLAAGWFTVYSGTVGCSVL